MEELKLHSKGQEDHLNEIKKKLERLKKSLLKNTKLSDMQKQVELKNIMQQLKKEKKDSDKNLY